MSVAKVLPDRWVDKIFHKMTMLYGRDFLGRWEGMPIAEVKADWAECLGCFADRGEAIAYGLANLPDGKPLTSQEFRAVCMRCPVSVPCLPEPAANPERVAQELAKLHAVSATQPAPPVGDKGWAMRLLQRVQDGDKTVRRAAIVMAQQALGMRTEG